jgi:hypothetical protein
MGGGLRVLLLTISATVASIRQPDRDLHILRHGSAVFDVQGLAGVWHHSVQGFEVWIVMKPRW